MARNNMFMLRRIREQLESTLPFTMRTEVLYDNEVIMSLCREVCQLALNEIFGVSTEYSDKEGIHDKVMLSDPTLTSSDYDNNSVKVIVHYTGKPANERTLDEIFQCIHALTTNVNRIRERYDHECKQLPAAEDIHLPAMSANINNFRSNIAGFISHMLLNPMDICNVSMSDVLAMNKIAKTYYKLDGKPTAVKGGIAGGLVLTAGAIATAAKIIAKRKAK